MARTTRREVESAFRRVMFAIGGDYNKEDVYSTLRPKDERAADGGNLFVVGRYALDYAPIYGGYRIVRCCNEHGGESDVTHRMRGREFVEAADFLGRVLGEQEITAAQTTRLQRQKEALIAVAEDINEALHDALLDSDTPINPTAMYRTYEEKIRRADLD
jgi:hypothetical protein